MPVRVFNQSTLRYIGFISILRSVLRVQQRHTKMGAPFYSACRHSTVLSRVLCCSNPTCPTLFINQQWPGMPLRHSECDNCLFSSCNPNYECTHCHFGNRAVGDLMNGGNLYKVFLTRLRWHVVRCYMALIRQIWRWPLAIEFSGLPLAWFLIWTNLEVWDRGGVSVTRGQTGHVWL